MADAELEEAEKDKQTLELRALKYVNTKYWGSPELDEVNKCFKDVDDVNEARRCIEEIIILQVWGDRKPCRTSLSRDEGLLSLLNIWNSLPSERQREKASDSEPAQQWDAFLDKVVEIELASG